MDGGGALDGSDVEVTVISEACHRCQMKDCGCRVTVMCCISKAQPEKKRGEKKRKLDWIKLIFGCPLHRRDLDLIAGMGRASDSYYKESFVELFKISTSNFQLYARSQKSAEFEM